MVKNILQRKKDISTKFIFKQTINTVYGVFLKIDTHSHGVDSIDGFFWQAFGAVISGIVWVDER